MAEWTQCPSCQLKHVARPDGLCPRCRHPIAVGWGAVPSGPVPPPEAVAVPTVPAGPGFPPAATYPVPTTPAPAAPAGMAAAPYAFTVGRFIGGVFTTWGGVAGLVIPVALVAYAPMAFAMYRMYAGLQVSQSAADPMFFFRGFAALVVMALILTPLERVAILRPALRRLAGEPVEVGDMISTAFRCFFPTLLMFLVVGLATTATVCTLMIVPMILLTGWAASLPAMIAEGLGPIEALKRSWALTRGLKWQVFAGFLVLVLILTAVSCVLQGVLTAVVVGAAAAAREDPQRMMGAMSVVQATNMLLQGVYDTFLTTATAVAYHQLRVAAEGPAAHHLEQVFA